jgi:predicted metal-dependent peptidase
MNNKPECLTRALIQLMLRSPFFSVLAMKCPFIADDRTQTMATDGKYYYFHPQYVQSLKEESLIGLLAHEICHNAFQHGLRKQGREHRRFNLAADYVINPLLIDGFGFELPPGYLYNSQYCDLTAESVYELLWRSEQPLPAWGEILDTPPEFDVKALAQDWDIALRQAVNVAKQAGQLPKQLLRLVDLQEARMDWRTLLRQHISGAGTEDLSYRKFHRQHQLHGFYVPDYLGNPPQTFVVGIDTSGSIRDELLGQFLGEVSAILEDCSIERVYVVYCDTQVNAIDIFTSQDLPIEPRAIGGGGTDFCPVFEWIETQDIYPDKLIYMTDLCGRFPPPPTYPVLWARTDYRVEAPYGDVIDLETVT